ncbi:MAG TPA: hypothetical protein VGX03_38685 [Candidatus Binatia bacterium]|nr:hypothetical protein [Candidatus Binatia bacterium]
MTYLASGFIRHGLPAGMRIRELRGVAGRLELKLRSMAKAAAKGRIYPGVADQAVGHSREIRPGGQIGLQDAPVAREACVLRVQMPAHVARL